jgi:MFS family permease
MKKERKGLLKVVFALEYMMQGLANPWQGVTYQPIFRIFKGFGLEEGAIQGLHSKSYLAWAFKPVLGFLIDAYGRTKTILILLLSMSVLGFLLTPMLDASAMILFWFLFGLSIVLAATDVAVDRASVIAGDEESKASGRSKSTTVGLNQAICWASIYGTSIIAASFGGYIADHFKFGNLMVVLAAVPAVLLAVVLMLPHDKAAPIPLKQSVMGFWNGLNSGPILGVMLFYFLFHFQPALGAIWNNHLLEDLKFSQTQVGISDGITNAGLFVGVLLFAWKGVKWQDRIGLRSIFRIYIVSSIALSLGAYLLLDPYFSDITKGLHQLLPFASEGAVRLGFLAGYNFLLAIGAALIRMSTFSLVGSIIPVAAAGSLFAGFMSVANFAYSCSYGTGGWLYEHGLKLGFLSKFQQGFFGIAPGEYLSLNMLILIGSIAYLLSFVCVHLLPDRKQTKGDVDMTGPEKWLVLPAAWRRITNAATLAGGAVLFAVTVFLWKMNPISAILISFFGFTMLRKFALDRMLRSVKV